MPGLVLSSGEQKSGVFHQFRLDTRHLRRDLLQAGEGTRTNRFLQGASLRSGVSFHSVAPYLPQAAQLSN